jgi:hypothetical protein
MGSRGRTIEGNSIVMVVEICHSTYVRMLREVFRVEVSDCVLPESLHEVR